MKRTRHRREQIVGKLHQAAAKLAGGRKIEEVCKSLAISPARRRTAVGHLQRELELSHRRACKVVGQPRATQRHTPSPNAQEDRLRERLNEFIRRRPRAGYRAVCGQLRQEGLRVNPKRVQRLWREEGLKVPRRQCMKRRLGTSANGSQRRVATRPNEVWTYDFVSDQTNDGRRLKILCVVDESTRGCLALEVGRSFRAREVQAWLNAGAIGAPYIAPGSPWENASVDSFNSRLRDEHLNRGISLPGGGPSPGRRMAAGLQRSEAALIAGVTGTGGVRGDPETMNQNSHSNWTNKCGLATTLEEMLSFVPKTKK